MKGTPACTTEVTTSSPHFTDLKASPEIKRTQWDDAELRNFVSIHDGASGVEAERDGGPEWSFERGVRVL